MKVEELVSDGLWELVEGLLPPEASKPRGGRPRLGLDAFSSIVYVLKTGVPWRMLPKEFGCSGVTCWRRLRDWQKAGVWRDLLKTLRDRLGRRGDVDWSRAALDSASVPAKRGARTPGPTP